MQYSPSEQDISWFQKKIMKWGELNFADFAWRTSEIAIHQLLVEILLQRTRAIQVLPVYVKLIDNYPDLESLYLLSETDISNIIHPLGLHWRAPLIHKLIQIIRNDLQGIIPEDFEQLKKLPGVGDYVSSAYLSLHRKLRSTIIDSNVVRIYARFFGFDSDGETRRKKWMKDLAEKITPQIKFRKFNYGLLDFAREICKVKPSCSLCKLNSRCFYAKSN